MIAVSGGFNLEPHFGSPVVVESSRNSADPSRSDVITVNTGTGFDNYVTADAYCAPST
jgi:hypothetical protein